MGTFKRIVLTLVCIAQIFLVNNKSVYAETIERKKIEVLFITSFNSNFISFSDQLEGIKSGLNNNCNINIEYMDLKILDNYEAEQNFSNLIKYKLDTYKNIDVIIAGDDEATEFCMKYRNDLFEGIPISFLGVQDYERSDRAVQDDLVSGVIEIESIKENIELIKKLHPKVDTITFIDTYGIELYNEILSQYDEFNINWIITDDMTTNEVKEALEELDENDALIELYIENYFYDECINSECVGNFIQEISNNIPVYNVLSYDIGTGSIGGKVISHFYQGKKAGEIVAKLLNGESNKDIYINDDSANEYIFDYNSLRNFGIKISDLPTNSKVLNNPFTIIKEYKGVALSILIFLVSLIIIIIALSLYIVSKRRYEKEMLKAITAAEEANRIKSHFISNISHELRTPINVIMSAIQLFKVNDKREVNFNRYIQNFDVIDDNCKRLTRLINNIIDIQNLELKEGKLKLTHINIVELIEDIVTSVIPYAENKNLSVVFDTTKEDFMMEVDIDKFERVILNLLSNAIKFSKENGEIRINLKFEDYFYVIIEDDGIGMDKDNIDNIFEKFIQLDNSLYRRNEGCGIGLAIVKSFVELHNGKIYVDSTLNRGSRFLLKFPISNKEILSNNELDKEKIKDTVRLELADIYL